MLYLFIYLVLIRDGHEKWNYHLDLIKYLSKFIKYYVMQLWSKYYKLALGVQYRHRGIRTEKKNWNDIGIISIFENFKFFTEKSYKFQKLVLIQYRYNTGSVFEFFNTTIAVVIYGILTKN